MGSGGGGGSNYGSMMAMMGQGTPMPGLPVAGKDSSIGDPYQYGKFQSFLPDIQASGQNDMATGLRPDMFNYRSPGGQPANPAADAEAAQLRHQLAELRAAQAAQPKTAGMRSMPGMFNSPYGPLYANPNPSASSPLIGLMGGNGQGFMGGGGDYGNPYGDPFQTPPGGA